MFALPIGPRVSALSGGSQPLDKVYLSSRDRAKLRRALESEVASLKRAQVSRNVVHLEGCFEDDASVYIVTEFCDGIDLASYVKEHGPLPESQAAAIIHECLEVLAVCHDKHILHGDIKPDNFMVRNAAAAAFVPASGAPQEDDRQPPHEQPAPASDQATAAATATQVVPPGRILHEPRGTPAYTAPEVYTRKYNKMADMWSLGVTCYYLLTGTYPYWHDMEAQPPREVMKTIIRQPFHLQDDARLAHVSPECRDFLDRLLQHNLSRRLTAHAALNHAWVSQTLP
ncbi:hypothetical protein WJX72_006796 [[Myrmecia] bisecta]|uniref:Protein kinase domain-containing protein n=1 Tax=[Myrmecia] bisecta TaxID=41462 RepID=A0AAW1QRX1_9CHLO